MLECATAGGAVGRAAGVVDGVHAGRLEAGVVEVSTTSQFMNGKTSLKPA